MALLHSRLHVVRIQPGGFIAHCPVPGHGKGRGDRHPSLSVIAGLNGTPVLKCWAGCAAEQVLAAVELTWGDLYEARRS